MDGVTILNSYLVSGVGAGILFIMCAIPFIVLAVLSFKDEEIGSGIAFSIFVFIFSIVTTICFCAQPVPHYEITISDDVSLVEFNRQYKVISQRGDIYVVEERDLNE